MPIHPVSFPPTNNHTHYHSPTRNARQADRSSFKLSVLLPDTLQYCIHSALQSEPESTLPVPFPPNTGKTTLTQCNGPQQLRFNPCNLGMGQN